MGQSQLAITASSVRSGTSAEGMFNAPNEPKKDHRSEKWSTLKKSQMVVHFSEDEKERAKWLPKSVLRCQSLRCCIASRGSSMEHKM